LGRRGHPEQHRTTLDCFVTAFLAMTRWGYCFGTMFLAMTKKGDPRCELVSFAAGFGSPHFILLVG
jgi:hypothetical protein